MKADRPPRGTAERPIIFSGRMVKAILAGHKTMTRRLLKPQTMFAGREEIVRQWPNQRGTGWEVGALLWVREMFSGPYRYTGIKPREWRGPFWYWADGNPEDGDWTRPKPSIHMPRQASRLTLAVTGVKVERLQDITIADALAEGALESGLPYVGAMTCDQARVAFSLLWDKLHGPQSWEANPYVVAVSFTIEPRGTAGGG